MSSRTREDNCIQENNLRAYLDSELSTTESEATSNHLATCPACAYKLSAVRAELADVDSLFAFLAPEQSLPTAAPTLFPIAHPSFAARFDWTAALSLSALAAVIIAAVFLLRHSSAPQSPVIVKQQPVQSVPAPVAAIKSQQPPLSTPPRHRSTKIQNANYRPNPRPFIPLDNDGPIESGLIYKVKLPGTIFNSLDPAVMHSQYPAEVIVDVWGRPRAIRFLATQVNSSRQGE
jgi:hypothetical protein